MPDVAVVIPVRNGERTITRAIFRVAQQARDLADDDGRATQIVVVDDASADATTRLAQDAADRCDIPAVVLRRPVRGGPNAARNDGVRATTAEIVVLLDGDDEPLPHWLARLTAAVDAEDVVAGGTYVVQGRDGRPVPILASTRRAFGYPYAVGGALATTRTLLDRVGGFDETLSRGGTDLELSIEAQRRCGARLVPVDDARVLHRVPRSVGARAHQHYARERGHQLLLRRLAADGASAPARTPAALSWSNRAAAAGGWHLLAAEVAGRAAGRLAFGRLAAPATPQRTGSR